MEITKEIKIKIVGKLYGIYIIKNLQREKTKITIPEFKFILGSFKIKKKNWFSIAKELEKDEIIKLHGGNPIEILGSNINVSNRNV